ncbi:uncharacterized protein LOC119608293 [Lucilia sericata]|uniref:uncharacterized protein LOC119608293 n=1 Tax=Lucilia sericata TaxID=13632 RepID=UPI0018A82049|nr:uncharacterized protein LOC119608293 [Lucilia sericata]XP_037818587.1 uncharacterized protein LOC119608293 [Lucilia sericata]XP_037818588.1 uncharacterized protein LOC119608293 [Lucilia sericata]XP_037818589.1 uncharacterized protein LOC119608293 [Lucilia sericata]
MSMNNLTIDGEFRYIVQWFNEWSELQRDDFVPILVKYITGSHTNEDDDNDDGLVAAAVTPPVNMNGLPNDLEFSGRPMSLFQCRIKLFNQWNRRWPTEFKEKLQQKIGEIDGKVGEKIKLALNPNNTLTNGYASNEEDPHSLELLKENGENSVIVANYATEIEAMALNDPMTEVLNNETSVDDIETNEDVSNSIEQPLFNNNTVTNTSSAPLQAGINIDDNNDVAAGNVNNDGDDDEVCSNNTTHNHAINEREEPVEQVVQMQNLQINEEKAEAEKDHEDVIAATVEQKQQPLPSITVTVNPVVVTQTITTNAEVPLVV